MNNTWLCSCGHGLHYRKRRVTEEGIERFYLCPHCQLVWCSLEEMKWSEQRMGTKPLSSKQQQQTQEATA